MVTRPFCIHPVMQVFADLRPSLVLVVRTGSEFGVRADGCFARASDSKGRLQIAAYRVASKHVGGACSRGKAGPSAEPGRASVGRRCRGA